MYAMELHRQFGDVGFQYLRGDHEHRLTFSLEAPAGWTVNSQQSGRRRPEEEKQVRLGLGSGLGLGIGLGLGLALA